MKTVAIKLYIFSIFLIFVLSGTVLAGNPMVHQQGVGLVDEHGDPLKLRGVNVEGWISWSGHLWGGGFVSQRQIRQHLVSLVGAEQTRHFEQAVYDNFITEKDIRQMSEMGFNVARILINHEILEDDARPYQYKSSGWQLLDQLLDWGERHGVYIVPCLISAPGGQSTWFIADPDKTLLWHDVENQRRTIALWRAMAARYHDRTIIAGYDLLNEPKVFLKQRLVDLYRKIINAVREVDPHHMIILEGTESSTNFSMFKGPLDDNQMYGYHVYNLIARRLLPDKSAEFIGKMRHLASKHHVPLWASEFGANTLNWTHKTVALFETPENNLSGWAFWPWKRVPSPHSEKDYLHLGAIRPSPSWLKLISSVGKRGTAGHVPREEALQAMDNFIAACRAENVIVNQAMAEVLKEFR